MCTVTFIPAEDTYFITSNRDESPSRQASGLTSKHDAGHPAVHFPVDDMSGGSWIAMNGQGRAVCLLNGGFEPFAYRPPYRLSRGQVVLAAAATANPGDFFEAYELTGIAPFTLLLFEDARLTQWVWDGANRHIADILPDRPHIWSSVTLYPADVRAWRKDLFEKWIAERNTFDRESILDFHRLANGDTDNDFIMNRNNIVKTLSITSIAAGEDRSSMLHLDLDHLTREEIVVRYGK